MYRWYPVEVFKVLEIPRQKYLMKHEIYLNNLLDEFDKMLERKLYF